MGLRENKGRAPIAAALTVALVVTAQAGTARAQQAPRTPSAPAAAWVAPVRAADLALPRLAPAPRALRGEAPRVVDAILPATDPAFTRGERMLIIVSAIVVGVLLVIAVASVARPR